ncbi:type II toxin-antitoxin system RelE/ParE family toxin [Bacteroides sp. 519]|uniref:type II toxin-antitoxin system RelE/ParE family toxin n=1 Tax=Bacteroides sp. 519 TaxID=2302937 RepID=UPI0013D47324|nr:type II toxin-antitoxin system RelE/ParE family toxin [Bacteroides sp. 519]NDV57213.1 type II toxin-antitoxin system RelE/ParE family toxin [Bacteroides sp. 519]
MELKWEPKALEQLKNLTDHNLRTQGKRATTQIIDDIQQAIIILSNYPNMGPVVPAFKNGEYSYRSTVIYPGYKVIYRIEDHIIYIYSIWNYKGD